jgi:predicted TIM-barrel fold metal-dependent hydrolase
MICDAHVHVGTAPDGALPAEASPRFVAGLLKTCGIAEFVFSSLGAQMGQPLSRIERDAAETREAFGAGAHAFLWLTGRFFDADPGLKALDSGIWEGVKLHEKETPWVKERPGDLERILRILEERGLPVQLHAGEDDGCRPRDLLPFVRRHPRLRADLSHCRPLGDAIRALLECPWLFADTAFMPPENYPALAAAGVADRVMFGTDFPAHVAFYGGTAGELYRHDLEAALGQGWSEDVMSGTFRRFLGKPPAGEDGRTVRAGHFPRLPQGRSRTEPKTAKRRQDMNAKPMNLSAAVKEDGQ